VSELVSEELPTTAEPKPARTKAKAPAIAGLGTKDRRARRRCAARLPVDREGVSWRTSSRRFGADEDTQMTSEGVTTGPHENSRGSRLRETEFEYSVTIEALVRREPERGCDRIHLCDNIG
jgi:hypothetical protein